MRRRLLSLIALAALAALALAPATHAQSADPAAAARSALAWMRSQQQPDGSFPGFGPGETADAVAAIVAAGERPDDFAKGGTTPLAYLESQAATFAATGAGAAAKLVLAAVAAGEDPGAFGGQNLFEQLGATYDPATGQYGPDVYGHTLALLAIRAARAEPPAAAVERLLGLQLEDGGWSFDGTTDTGSDTNTTALAVQALAGRADAADALVKAQTYLKSQQNDDGGFPYSQTSQFGNASDANSTAAVIQALSALGEDPAGEDWAPGGNTPLDALVGLQNSGGAFRYQASQADDNALATYQAVPALLGKALPVATRAVAGAQDAVAPAAGAPAASLPATGAPAEAPLAALALAALALVAAGAALRRVC
jgi:hypothetical protein